MRLVDADDIDDQIRQEFGIPVVVGRMDNPNGREAITILNMLSDVRTIIPGRDDIDPAQCYVIGCDPTPDELINLLRKAAKHKPRYIGTKPKMLYDLAADCITRLMRGDDDDHRRT